MLEIHKKIDPEYFEQILQGQKTFEYRVADFACEPGDILILEEYAPAADTGERQPTGRTLRKKVGYVARTKDFTWLGRPDVQAAYEQYGAQIISLLEDK